MVSFKKIVGRVSAVAFMVLVAQVSTGCSRKANPSLRSTKPAGTSEENFQDGPLISSVGGKPAGKSTENSKDNRNPQVGSPNSFVDAAKPVGKSKENSQGKQDPKDESPVREPDFQYDAQLLGAQPAVRVACNEDKSLKEGDQVVVIVGDYQHKVGTLLKQEGQDTFWDVKFDDGSTVSLDSQTDFQKLGNCPICMKEMQTDPVAEFACMDEDGTKAPHFHCKDCVKQWKSSKQKDNQPANCPNCRAPTKPQRDEENSRRVSHRPEEEEKQPEDREETCAEYCDSRRVGRCAVHGTGGAFGGAAVGILCNAVVEACAHGPCAMNIPVSAGIGGGIGLAMGLCNASCTSGRK